MESAARRTSTNTAKSGGHPDAMMTEEMRSSPYDEIEFLDGPGGNQESAYGAETEKYLRSHRDFTKEDAEGVQG